MSWGTDEVQGSKFKLYGHYANFLGGGGGVDMTLVYMTLVYMILQ